MCIMSETLFKKEKLLGEVSQTAIAVTSTHWFLIFFIKISNDILLGWWDQN